MSTRLERTLGSPLYATLVTVLVLVAGVLGSLYAVEIQTAFPCPFVVRGCTPAGTPNAEALLFWSFVVLAGLLFFGRQRALDRARERTEQEFRDLVRTLPPTGFLSVFNDLHSKASDVVFGMLATPPAELTVESAARAVRAVLGCVAELTYQYDERQPLIEYGANIMIFRPGTELAGMSDDERKVLQRRLHFVEPGMNMEGLCGVLDLRCDLSTTSKTDDYAPDSALNPLALPVPLPENVKSGDGLRYRVLPGAPLAYTLGELSVYRDTGTLAEWCRREKEFSETIIQQVEAFFSDAKHSQSFLSLPLARQRAIGVLNVHRSAPGILHDGEAVPSQHFYSLVAPFRWALLILLEKLQECETRAAAGETEHGALD